MGVERRIVLIIKLPTLKYLIVVPVRLFIFEHKLPKNLQFLAFLCSKPSKLHAYMLLLHPIRLFDTSEYVIML